MEESKRDILWDKFSFDDIELGDIIGGGGVGLVYSGWIKGRNEAVAFKTLFDSRVNEELRREYLDELQVLSRVNHSNIVSFLGACITPPNLFFVMELCVCSLFDIIHKNKESFENLECIRMAVSLFLSSIYFYQLLDFFY
jgi:serine/threonine protein kinase